MTHDSPTRMTAEQWRQQARMCGPRQDLVAFCLEQAEDIEREGDTTLAEMLEASCERF
jgi:hypothetical protein